MKLSELYFNTLEQKSREGIINYCQRQGIDRDKAKLITNIIVKWRISGYIPVGIEFDTDYRLMIREKKKMIIRKIRELMKSNH